MIGLIGIQLAKGRQRAASQPNGNLFCNLHRIADDQQRIRLAYHQLIAANEQSDHRVEQKIHVAARWFVRGGSLPGPNLTGGRLEFVGPREKLVQRRRHAVAREREHGEFQVADSLRRDRLARRQPLFAQGRQVRAEHLALVFRVEQDQETGQWIILAWAAILREGERELSLRQAAIGVKAHAQFAFQRLDESLLPPRGEAVLERLHRGIVPESRSRRPLVEFAHGREVRHGYHHYCVLGKQLFRGRDRGAERQHQQEQNRRTGSFPTPPPARKLHPGQDSPCPARRRVAHSPHNPLSVVHSCVPGAAGRLQIAVRIARVVVRVGKRVAMIEEELD